MYPERSSNGAVCSTFPEAADVTAAKASCSVEVVGRSAVRRAVVRAGCWNRRMVNLATGWACGSRDVAGWRTKRSRDPRRRGKSVLPSSPALELYAPSDVHAATREWRMILKLRLRSVLCAFAIVMVALNLFAMGPAAASPHRCEAARVETVSDHHHDAGAQPGCCDSMHCCPMLPRFPLPRMPSQVRFHPHTHLKTEQPLLLVASIDPPPRSPAS